MARLTFSLNLTLDGCIDHREGIADEETHAFFTQLMDDASAMLWGRVTYEIMESFWPSVARGEVAAPAALREWAVKLEQKTKYVVSTSRQSFPWHNSHHLQGDLKRAVQALKDSTSGSILLGSNQLACALDAHDLIDDYVFLLHPRLCGHGPTLFHQGLPATRKLSLQSTTMLSNGAVALRYQRI